MKAAAGLVAGLLLALLPGVAVAADQPPPAREVFRFQDPRIVESSGLVDLGDLMVTVNDSGDSARVFVVDPQTGASVGTTSFAAAVKDVESLAPAGPRAVWVGDTGGNISPRDHVEVYRIPVARGEHRLASPERYRLTYPEGEHDAESLFAGPRGRLHLVTKSFAGGIVYRAPARLTAGGRNLLEPVGRVADYATDAALMRDGRHVLIRSPFQASVYTVPGFARVATFPLPRQRQGEGISVGPGGRLRISTEGAHSGVLEVALPADVVRRLREPADQASSTAPLGEPTPAPDHDRSGSWLGWGVAAALAVGAAAVGIAFRRGHA